MNEFCAAMGLCNLKHLKAEIAKRKRVVELYRKYLENIDGIQLIHILYILRTAISEIPHRYIHYPLQYMPFSYRLPPHTIISYNLK